MARCMNCGAEIHKKSRKAGYGCAACRAADRALRTKLGLMATVILDDAFERAPAFRDRGLAVIYLGLLEQRLPVTKTVQEHLIGMLQYFLLHTYGVVNPGSIEDLFRDGPAAQIPELLRTIKDDVHNLMSWHHLTHLTVTPHPTGFHIDYQVEQDKMGPWDDPDSKYRDYKDLMQKIKNPLRPDDPHDILDMNAKEKNDERLGK